MVQENCDWAKLSCISAGGLRLGWAVWRGCRGAAAWLGCRAVARGGGERGAAAWLRYLAIGQSIKF